MIPVALDFCLFPLKEALTTINYIYNNTNTQLQPLIVYSTLGGCTVSHGGGFRFSWRRPLFEEIQRFRREFPLSQNNGLLSSWQYLHSNRTKTLRVTRSGQISFWRYVGERRRQRSSFLIVPSYIVYGKRREDFCFSRYLQIQNTIIAF